MKTQGGEHNRIFIILLILVMTVPRFFYFSGEANASDASVAINEFAWMGTGVSANDEWIELFNKTSADIDLSGWVLGSRDGAPSINLKGIIRANDYFLLERTDDDTVPGVAADQIYSGALGNDGEYLELFDKSNGLVDAIDESSGWTAGSNATKQTWSRKLDGGISSSMNPGGTPRRANDFEPMGANTDNGGETDAGDAPDSPVETANPASYLSGTVVINEIVSDPGDGEEEWVELYNASGEELNLDSWTIEDGSGAKTVFSHQFGISGSLRYFVIEKPRGSLNNSGDTLVLRDAKGVYIDSLTYGNWDDGNKSDNAPLASDANSLARIVDGRNSGNNSEDFAVTKKSTKGGENIIETAEKDPVESGEQAAKKNDVVISEIFPNPSGSDAEGEFIELYNNSDSDVDLLEWQIGNSKGAKYRFKASQALKSKDYFVIYRKESGLVQNNDEDTIFLYNKDRKSAVYKLKYSDVLEGRSLNCIDNDMNILGVLANVGCMWSNIPTPGKKNIIEEPNRAPVADFSFADKLYEKTSVVFDSSDSFDSNNDKLSFEWDFGDGYTSAFEMPDHIYQKAGKYKVKLKVCDGEFDDENEKEVKILENNAEDAKASNIDKGKWKELKIVKVLPNPVGADGDGEWLEIMNKGKDSLDLLNWRIDDAEGGSRPFAFNDSVIISSGKTFKLSREDSGLAFNNNGDSVRLIAPDKSVVDSVDFGKSREGEVYEKGDKGVWTWVSVGGEYEETESSSSKKKKSGTSVKIAKKVLYDNAAINGITADDVGKKVVVKGRVTALPNTFSSQYFYIEDGAGLQVYSNQKEFPALKVGDMVIVKGELSQINSEMRLKTKNKSEIAVVGHKENEEAKKCSCAELENEDLGLLVNVAGEIVKKQGANIFLDDGSGETKLYVKPTTGIVLADMEVGKKINAKGILSSSASGRRVMPRSREDLQIADPAKEVGQVAGTETTSTEWGLASGDKSKKASAYYSMLAVTGLIIGLVVFFRYRKRRLATND